MKHFFVIFILILCILIQTSCHNKSVQKHKKHTYRTDTAKSETKNEVAEAFIKQYHARIPEITHFQAKAKLEYSSAKEKLSANVIIRSRYDSVLWISVIPLLGIEAARIKITRDSFYVLDKINHTVTISAIKKIEEKFGASVTLKELQDLLLGLSRVPNKITTYQQGKMHFVTATQNNIEYAFEIQKELLLHSLFLKEKQNNYTSDLHYLNYKDTPLQNNTIKLPYYITANVHTKENVQAELTYTKVNLTAEKLNIPFEFSRNYKIIYQ